MKRSTALQTDRPKIVVFNGDGLGKTLLKKSLIKHYEETGIKFVSLDGTTDNIQTAIDGLSGFDGFILIETHGYQVLPVKPWQTITFQGALPA